MKASGGDGIKRAGVAIAALGVLAISGYAHAGTLILEYKFDETGTTAASTGSDATSLTMYNGGSATDLHTAGGTGVSGAANDRAFDAQATAMGVGGSGGLSKTSGPLASLSPLTSLTISGWIKPASGLTLGNGARLFDYYDNTTAGGFRVIAGGSGSTGSLNLYVNGSLITGSAAKYTSADWMFFAITYDSSSHLVDYYLGDKKNSVSLVSEITNVNLGAMAATTTGLYVNGAYPGTNVRPFDGLMDDIRINGSTTDASGSLSVSQLEVLRQSDIAVPEPATASIALAGIAVAYGVLLRRK